MKRTLKFLAALTPVLAFTPAVATAQTSGAPVVAVLAFDNGAFGPAAKDYDGIGKGIMDLVITDLASSPKVRVVDRERVQKILEEQNLTRTGAVDGATAVRVGRLFGACYSVYGTFIRNDKTGDNVLTIHTTSNETGQIMNAQKVANKGDDIMALIAEASTKFANGVDVKACAGAGTARGNDNSAAAAPAAAAPKQQSAAAPKPQSPSAPATSAPASITAGAEKYAKALSARELETVRGTKLDARTTLLYSRAIDAQDHKDNTKAIALYQQVVSKYPTFAPAADRLNSLKKSGD